MTVTNTDLWSHKNEPAIIWYCDPDKVAHFFATIVEHERSEQVEIITSIYDLFDPDTCPTQYLPYLADMVGVKIDNRDREETWRAQIRTAVAWYKEKGKMNSFTILFRTMGMNVEIYPLWINEQGEAAREALDASWKPHARIDLVIREYPEWQRYFPDNLQYVINKMEEVRPIHVLLRGIFLGWDLFDSFPFEDITEIDEDLILGQFSDQFVSVYYAHCGIWHFESPQNIFRDGGGYEWLRDVDGIIADPPTLPSEGDRYVVASSGTTGVFVGHENEVAEYSGGAWVYYTAAVKDALWVKSGSPPIEPLGAPGDWKAYFWNGLAWQPTWVLFEGRTAPGPFFRECRGSFPCPDIPGICDELEVDVEWNPDPDPFEYCMYHDASVTGIPPHPVNGGIQRRDGTFFHNCRVVFDHVEYDATVPPLVGTDTFPDASDVVNSDVTVEFDDDFTVPHSWDSGILWDAPDIDWDADLIAHDYLEIWITDHIGGGPPYKWTGKISGQ